MSQAPAVVVHSLDDARRALAPGKRLTLLSAPSAALYAGCLWWRELADAARAEHPGLVAADILDCGERPGRALEALRAGQRVIVLSRSAPGFADAALIAESVDAVVLTARPAALDMAERLAPGRLEAWLSEAGSPQGAG